MIKNESVWKKLYTNEGTKKYYELNKSIPCVVRNEQHVQTNSLSKSTNDDCC